MYNLSTDYEQLYELIYAGNELVCFVDNREQIYKPKKQIKKTRVICTLKWSGDFVTFEAMNYKSSFFPGVKYIKYTKMGLKRIFKALNLQFIPPC